MVIEAAMPRVRYDEQVGTVTAPPLNCVEKKLRAF